MPYYVTTEEYVGPNRTDSKGRIIPREPLACISTVPPRTNMSGQIKHDGWLGTTNDTGRNAHGAYETLDEAREACERLGCTVQVTEDRDGEPLADPLADEGDPEYWTTPAALAQHWDAADWFSSARPADLGITADTTGEELAAIMEREEAEALAHRDIDCRYGVILHGLGDLLREWREDLRAERETVAA